MSQQSRYSFDPFAWNSLLPPDQTHVPAFEELESSHPAHKAWMACRKNFFSECMDYRFGGTGHHSAIYVDVYGIPDVETNVVFVVWMGLCDFQVRYHEAIRERVRNFVEANLPPRISIRFYRLEASILGAGQVPQRYPKIRKYAHDEIVYAGDSIGPSDHAASGTIACFLRLRNKEGMLLPDVFALTCHHVVVSKFDGSVFHAEKYPAKQTPEQANKMLLEQVESPIDRVILVNSPSDRDSLATRDNLLTDLGKYYDSIDTILKMMQPLENDHLLFLMRKMVGRDSKQALGHHKFTCDPFKDIALGREIFVLQQKLCSLPAKVEARLSTLKEQKQVEEFDASFGSVFASPGFQYYLPKYVEPDSQPSTLDVALVKMNPARIAVNWIRGFEEKEMQEMMAKFSDTFGGMLCPPVSYKSINATREVPVPGFRPGSLVMKCGRSSGFTCGTRLDRQFFGEQPFPSFKQHEEWVVQSHEKDTATVFSAGGDSGAAVLDQEGRVLGILFGGGNNLPDDSIDATWVLPWPEIEERLEKLTDCTIEWEDTTPKEAKALAKKRKLEAYDIALANAITAPQLRDNVGARRRAHSHPTRPENIPMTPSGVSGLSSFPALPPFPLSSSLQAQRSGGRSTSPKRATSPQKSSLLKTAWKPERPSPSRSPKRHTLSRSPERPAEPSQQSETTAKYGSIQRRPGSRSPKKPGFRKP